MKPLTLLGSQRSVQPLRVCDKCDELSAPEGGVQVSPKRWLCANCWISLRNRKHLPGKA